MVHRSEDIIKKYLESWNITVVHGGSPDFLCYRGNPKNDTVNRVFFVEVKSNRSPVLTEKQFKINMYSNTRRFYSHNLQYSI